MVLPRLTLKHFFEYCTTNYGKEKALSFVDGEPFSYSELYDKVQYVSGFLQKSGIRAGDRVAILGENSPNWVVAYFAITTMGAIVVPILPDFLPDQVQHILHHSNSKALFISEKQYEKNLEAEFDAHLRIYLLNTFSEIRPRTPIDKLKEMLRDSGKELAKLKIAALKLAKRYFNDVMEDDVASIIYTSGTTGHSKGVMLTHKNLVSNAIASAQIQPIQPGDRMLSVLPLSHTYECTVGLLVAFTGGACTYYFEKPPSPNLLVEAMKKIKPTVMLTVPLIIEKVYKNRILPQFQKNAIIKSMYKNDFLRKKLHKLAGKKLYKSFGGCLHFFGIGGAKLATEVEQFLKDAEFPYAIGYGLTETSPLLAGAGPTQTRVGSTGPAAPGVQLKINSPDPYSQEGEILAKGPNVMKGYYNDPELTAQVFTRDGWFRTGDLGIFDKDDFLYIKGRLKNVLIGPSGENIYPEEIETQINACDYVVESLVYYDQGKIAARVHLNYPSLDRDFKVSGELELKKKIEELLKRIQQQVNKKLTGFSRINKIIEQTEPFEKTPTQKIKRFLYIR
ncbi:MAG TPA: AMP-binding protein [bacterium]|nr:AMP-binding protein [bacterium]HPN42745.1 AMP-binding protein [bacterium]